MADSNYKIDLDIYSGPLDLLLYLIKQEEVDIYDIPISRVTEQYLIYIEALKYINLDLAGDFLVMASRLMEIKAKMLAPEANVEEEGEEEDPRLELVRQLIEYKKYKEAARDLQDLAQDRALRFGRPAEKHEEEDKQEGEEESLGEASLWDLLNAFSRLMRETGVPTETTITLDDIPVEEYMRRVFEIVSQRRVVSFVDLFPDRNNKLVIIGTFLALLELVRLRKIKAEQATAFGEIHIVLREEEPNEAPPPDDAEPQAEPAAAEAPPEGQPEPEAQTGSTAEETTPPDTEAAAEPQPEADPAPPPEAKPEGEPESPAETPPETDSPPEPEQPPKPEEE